MKKWHHEVDSLRLPRVASDQADQEAVPGPVCAREPAFMSSLMGTDGGSTRSSEAGGGGTMKSGADSDLSAVLM